MTLSDVATKILDFIRAGYPQGVPPTDYYPLLALLRHRLTHDEVTAVAEQLAAAASCTLRPAISARPSPG